MRNRRSREPASLAKASGELEKRMRAAAKRMELDEAAARPVNR